MKLSDFCEMIVIELGECKIYERKLEIKKMIFDDLHSVQRITLFQISLGL